VSVKECILQVQVSIEYARGEQRMVENLFSLLLREEKMTQGWVVYGGKRHAEPQREMFSRSYLIIKPT
jgi:hypothetical protein